MNRVLCFKAEPHLRVHKGCFGSQQAFPRRSKERQGPGKGSQSSQSWWHLQRSPGCPCPPLLSDRIEERPQADLRPGCAEVASVPQHLSLYLTLQPGIYSAIPTTLQYLPGRRHGPLISPSASGPGRARSVPRRYLTNVS